MPPLLCCVLLIAAASPAQSTVPVTVKGTIDGERLSATGRTMVDLEFTPVVALKQALAVRLQLRRSAAVLVDQTHTPIPPTRLWKKGEVVRYQVPLVLPLAGPDDPKVRRLDLFLAFVRPADEAVLAPHGARGGFVEIATCEVERDESVLDAAGVDALVRAARQEAKTGESAAAWDQLELGFRRIEDYQLKAEIRDALTDVGRFEPPPQSVVEQEIVGQRIKAERRRYLRRIAGGMFDREKYHGALMILDAVGGQLREDADRAYIGSLGDAKAVNKDRDDIVKKILEGITDAERQQVVALRERLGEDSRELLDHGLKLWKKRSWTVAREILRGLCHVNPDDIRAEAVKQREKLEAEWLKAVPADQKREAAAAMNHPAWARTKSVVTHKFILIGPETVIRNIPAPSKLRFDLAYVYITDLFGRIPNPEGDRVTVYFKELWDFGGGVGGGKIIDVGSVDPKNEKQRVDTGLFYHEFTHCADDTNPVCGGFREGLADFGAAFAYQGLGQRADIRRTLGGVRRAFLRDYLERDLEFWRIPNYGPSAGFFLHFIDKYGRDKRTKLGHRWELYRRFFRSYRECSVKDARTPTVARAIAHHMMLVFGPQAFDDLVRFRFPLIESDRQAVITENESAGYGRNQSVDDFEKFPGSPVPRDLTATDLVENRGEVEDYMEDLGIVRDWWVIGPFKRPGTITDAFVFPPEYEIDLKKKYPVPNHNVTWRRPDQNRTVRLGKTGWVKFDYTYMDDTAIFALTHVRVDQAADAVIHIRADDDVTLFLNDELVGKYRYAAARRIGPWRPRSRVKLPDAIKFAVKLQPGRNKVLLKIYNRWGSSGCVMAVSRPDGNPLPDWSTDAEPPKKVRTRIELPNTKSWKKRLDAKFTQRRAVSNLETVVGRFRVRSKALEGYAKDGKVPWRKYTVRPGFRRDSPSNLAWLKKKLTKDVQEFHLKIEVDRERAPPKLCVMFQGQGFDDPLSGWSLILTRRDERVQARLERYDRLVYQSDRVPLASGRKESPVVLDLFYFGQRLSAKIGDQVLLDQVPVRGIPQRSRIGIATWGPDTRIKRIQLHAPRGRTR